MSEVVTSYLPAIAVLAPFLAGTMVYYIGRKSEHARDIVSIATCIVSFLAIAAMAPAVLGGKVIELILISGEVAPVEIALRVDKLSLIIAMVCSFEWILATIYSIRYMDHEHARNRYYTFMLLTLGSVLGVLLTKNLFALFIFFELMLLTSYVLVIHEETPAAMKAGKLYLFLGIGTGLVLFLAIVMTYMMAGTLNFGLGGILEYHGTMSYLIFIAFLIGAMAKAGIFPLHLWLPVAHPIAPSPASALLSGVLVKEGCYLMIRVIYDVFGVDLVAQMGVHLPLAILAGFTMFFGSAVAIKQTNLKTMLGYSTIGQMGYIFLGMSLLTIAGLQGAIVHIIHHAMMKGALFLTAGAIIYKTGIREIGEMAGIGKKMPITMLVFTITAISMIGIPPLCGFISKWMLAMGALETGAPVFMIFIVVLILSSIMNAAYFMPIIISAYFGEEDHDKKVEYEDVPVSMLVPMAILALGCIIFGIFTNISFSAIVPAVNALFGA
ncbi:MAG: monovalent cation/H+ antiporter subunit D family protein [Methanocellales archaeon]|nr:monovalent cation/H+ antiporter subunit D family protein [Methanocellales archaeon]